MSEKVYIMDFKNKCIGSVHKTSELFLVNMAGLTVKSTFLPRIMQGIAPTPSQFPAANVVLDYYNMDYMDVWTYLQRSNGFKESRDIWFMSEPIGEVWVPLVLDMQRYHTPQAYEALFRIGDPVKVLMNGKAYINRHTIDIFPPCIIPFLRRDGESRFSTTLGYVKDLAEYPSTRGLIGRIVLNFPDES